MFDSDNTGKESQMIGPKTKPAKELLLKLRENEELGDKLSTTEFQSAVKSVLDLEIITEPKLAAKCKMGLQTINRWRRGVTAPHPLLRGSVITTLIGETQSFL